MGKRDSNSAVKSLIKAILILYFSVIGVWLYALSDGFGKAGLYILIIIATAFWICLYILTYKLSHNKIFSYIIWLYFIGSVIMTILEFILEVNIPRFIGVIFLIVFGSVWAPISLAPEYILRLINGNASPTGNNVILITVFIISGIFVIVYFASRYINHKRKGDENVKIEEVAEEN